jgi:geranylgeranyl pyrophosphate synthase
MKAAPLDHAPSGTSAAPDPLDALRDQVERSLELRFAGRPQTEVLRAARYATLPGGHRWRSLLAVAAGRIFQPGPEPVLPLACALELLHAASLVLDDLPSMDNAQTRRGKPCLHLVFPPWVTDMVPAFLVNMAYHACADNPAAPEERRLRVILLLGEIGESLARGQERDLALARTAVSESALLDCYALKSGSLFAAALAGGGLLTGAGPADAAALRTAGLKLGQAYQYLDDLSDLSDPSDLATPAVPDAGKCTAVTLLGTSGARARAEALLSESLQALDRFGPAADSLRALIRRFRPA